MKALFYILVFGIITLTSCNWKKQTNPEESKPIETPKTASFAYPDFDADSAYYFIKKQVDFGPRVPNTKGHDACASWMIDRIKTIADTYYIQQFDATAYNGTILKSKNIIAALNPTATRRILLVAHWDTRPVADQDKERQKEPIPGANDGASGVGVLLEVLRELKQMPLQHIGVDILLVDSEDYGQPSNSGLPYVPDSYCLGSQHWSKMPHIPDYKADFGILLDMVGGENALFTREGTSRAYAGWVLDRVWSNAAQIGFGQYFSNAPTDAIVDDHKYINEIAKIPTIDIIQYDVSTPSGFAAYWHTHKDDLSAIDKKTLKAVGQTLIYTVYQYDSEMKPL